jgi:hypothetical protein
VALGQLLSDERACDRVAEHEHEHAQLDLLALGERAGQAQRVVGPLAAVGLVVGDHEDSHRLIVGDPGVCGHPRKALFPRSRRPHPPSRAE